jgi:hypothetical protein
VLYRESIENKKIELPKWYMTSEQFVLMFKFRRLKYENRYNGRNF